jgi:hypothetical protein
LAIQPARKHPARTRAISDELIYATGADAFAVPHLTASSIAPQEDSNLTKTDKRT